MDGSGIIRKSEDAMPAFSSTTLKIEDLGGELQFTVTRKSGWVSFVVMSGLLAAVSTYAVLSDRYFLLLFGVIGATAALINWVKGPVTLLRVSEARILATGNLHRLSDSDFELSADKITSIGWSFGGRNRSEGLHVWHGLMGSTCVLPGLSEKQAKQVTDTIAAQFPHYKIAGLSKSMFEFSRDS